MNVDKVKYNLYNSSVQNRNKIPSFKANAPQVVRNISEAEFSEEIKHIMPPFIRGMKKVHDNMGEVQNIIINAIGTAFVAPIFIKWNPLSKTDEDTRTYSAWRQPVSAALSVVTQVGVTIPVNNFISKLANNGYYGEKYNQTLFQDKKYIAKILKKQYPYLTKTQLDAKIEKHINEQKTTLLRMIRDNNVILSRLNQPSVPMSRENFTNLQINTLENTLIREKDELKKCTDVKIPLKIKRGTYYQAHTDEAKKIFEQINSKLASSTPENTKTYVKGLKKTHAKSDPELLKVFDEICASYGNTKEDLKIAMQDRLTGILEDIDMYEKCKDNKEVEQLVNQIVGVRVEQLKSSTGLLEKGIEAVKRGDNVSVIEKMIEEAVESDSSHRLKKFKFAEEIANQLKKQVKNNIQGHKQIVGLIVSFLVLPVSCWLLNWSYPRFMDAVFPNLSSKKHPNEIKSLVDKANNKKAEVK